MVLMGAVDAAGDGIGKSSKATAIICRGNYRKVIVEVFREIDAGRLPPLTPY
jgi:hypothetical protein